MTVPTTESNYEMVPEWTFLARCSKIIDIGTQEDEYKGEIKHVRKLSIHFEIIDELNSEGKPFSIFREFSYSMWEKSNLRKFLEAWRGWKYNQDELHDFHIFKEFLTRPGQITVEHRKSGTTGNTYAVISSVVPLLKGMTCPELKSEPVWFNLEHFQSHVYESFSEKLQEIIAKSPEYNNLAFRTTDEVF